MFHGRVVLDDDFHAEPSPALANVAHVRAPIGAVEYTRDAAPMKSSPSGRSCGGPIVDRDALRRQSRTSC